MAAWARSLPEAATSVRVAVTKNPPIAGNRECSVLISLGCCNEPDSTCLFDMNEHATANQYTSAVKVLFPSGKRKFEKRSLFRRRTSSVAWPLEDA